MKEDFLIKASCETQAWPNPSQQEAPLLIKPAVQVHLIVN